MTNLKERIVSLEKRLQMKDKVLLEKDKLLTELKGKNFNNENNMRNKLRDIDKLHNMKVDNLNKKRSTLLREIAGLKRTNKKNGAGGASGASTTTTISNSKDNVVRSATIKTHDGIFIRPATKLVRLDVRN